ncbi:hypothetical protein [Lysinibacillus sp. NPDC056232]|uniref:hypothetical protein n=1 Tax=Lysinibacillus sp. NPDC056232 TaxID=3345756 RepID=UPI0035E00C27
MKKVKGFNIFGVVSMTLMTFVIGATFTYYLSVKDVLPMDATLYGSYISGIGSFLGGVFGGIIAYFVARTQFIIEKNKNEELNKNSFNNAIKSLQIEIKHNLEVFKIIKDGNNTEKLAYCNAFEINIWNEIRFNIVNELNQDLYTLIGVHYKDCKDLKAGLLPDYKELEKFNFNTRIKTAGKLLKDLEEQLK